MNRKRQNDSEIESEQKKLKNCNDTKRTLLQHFQISSKHSSSCSVCSLTVDGPDLAELICFINEHKKEHSLFKYNCKFCNEHTNEFNEILSHVINEHNMPNYAFECSCGRLFKDQHDCEGNVTEGYKTILQSYFSREDITFLSSVPSDDALQDFYKGHCKLCDINFWM